MSKAKASSGQSGGGLFVTKTSKLADGSGNAIPRGRLVSGAADQVEALVKSGKLRPASDVDLSKARQFFQKPVRLKA